MALPTELTKIRANLRSKIGKTVNEQNLLAELDALDQRTLTETASGINVSVTKSAGSGANCPCCGR